MPMNDRGGDLLTLPPDDPSLPDTSAGVNNTGSLVESGFITPASFSTNQNDYAPAGFSTARTILQSVGSTSYITGLAGGVSGRVITFVNPSSSTGLGLGFSNESASSTAANRFALQSDFVLSGVGGSASFIYDGAASRWRLIATWTSTLAPNMTFTNNADGNASGSYRLSGSVASSSTVPTLIPNKASATTGIGASAAGEVSLITAGVEVARVTPGGITMQPANAIITSSNASGPQIANSTASSTLPTLIPNRASSTTGIGAQAAGNLSLIVAGVEKVRATGTGILVNDPIEQPDVTTPSAPTDGVKVFSSDIAGRSMLSTIGADGIAQLQSSMAHRRNGRWGAQEASTVINTDGIASAPVVAVGTATARSVATGAGTLAASSTRVGVVSAAIAASASVLRGSSTGPRLWRGSGVGLGGFYAVFRFNISDAVLVGTANMFVGLIRDAISTDAAPSTLTNLIGIGCDSGDTTLQLYASGAVAQTRASLGASFPVNTTNVDVYELTLYAPPNSATIGYRVARLNTGDVASGTISAAANMPLSTTVFGPIYFRGNGATAAAIGFDMHQTYVETP